MFKFFFQHHSHLYHPNSQTIMILFNYRAVQFQFWTGKRRMCSKKSRAVGHERSNDMTSGRELLHQSHCPDSARLWRYRATVKIFSKQDFHLLRRKSYLEWTNQTQSSFIKKSMRNLITSSDGHAFQQSRSYWSEIKQEIKEQRSIRVYKKFVSIEH